MISDEIRRLHELHQAGALSDAEFEQAKAKVLASEKVSLDKDGRSTGTGSSEGPAPGSFEAKLRSLRRSRHDRWLGGVCGALSIGFGMDIYAWRLVFVLLTFVTSGVGALAYLALWIFIPEE
ncbi:PspC domain-containing protein [Massilia sp. MS-15]|uniref:PspC domain-containing protein n=1 Tax=Massilia sp. MS-15 TaxID=2878200 RepID=UPI001CD70747|nr:PspC domain-containing protein [Massilia sp. MS-15]MCA1245159.1 PspC domain-containing protein [Massilia sp. MS-15]